MHAKDAISGTLVWTLMGALLVGCSSALGRESAEIPRDSRVLIAQPCPELAASVRSASARGNKVLIETAIVASNDLRMPVATSLIDHPVAIRSVGSLFGTVNQTQIWPWWRCRTAECDAWDEGTLELVPRASPRDPDVLEIEMTIRLREAAGPPVTATILTRDQRPEVVEVAAALPPGWSLVVTPYRLGNDGLRQLWQCKERLRGSTARGRSG